MVGQFFFENDHVNAVTVTKERCFPVLEQFWRELEMCKDLDEKEQKFQPNGASALCVNVTVA